MASIAATGRATDLTMPSTDYERFAGVCAMAAGVLGFVYSVAFVVLKNNLLSALMLLLIGLLTTAVVVAVYGRLKETDASFALWGLLLGLAGGLGMAVHGGFDLSNAVHPPTTGFSDIP